MNKQAITFFSLFSLILVLSVYYVMIPPLTSEDSNIVQEASLQDKLNEKREIETETQNNILASSTSSGEELNEAIETLNETKTATSMETNVKTTLNALGYEDVFCEINGNIIKVTITKKGATHEDAVVIMEAVLETCDEKYSPEIKFIDE